MVAKGFQLGVNSLPGGTDGGGGQNTMEVVAVDFFLEGVV